MQPASHTTTPIARVIPLLCLAGLVLLAPATHPWPGGVTWYYDLAARPVVGPLFSWTVALPVGEFWMIGYLLIRGVRRSALPDTAAGSL